MARIRIPFDEPAIYSTKLEVRIGDINYGGHLGHDTLFTLAHEARCRFFRAHGYSELDVDGAGVILSDVAAEYKAEAFQGDTLCFELALADFHKYGFDILYRVSDDKLGKEVARLKTGIVFFDYAQRRITSLPDGFATRFSQKQGGGS
jgi:4-hydroxybenzoyl-CoA thioesterase